MGDLPSASDNDGREDPSPFAANAQKVLRREVIACSSSSDFPSPVDTVVHEVAGAGVFKHRVPVVSTATPISSISAVQMFVHATFEKATHRNPFFCGI